MKKFTTLEKVVGGFFIFIIAYALFWGFSKIAQEKKQEGVKKEVREEVQEVSSVTEPQEEESKKEDKIIVNNSVVGQSIDLTDLEITVNKIKEDKQVLSEPIKKSLSNAEKEWIKMMSANASEGAKLVIFEVKIKNKMGTEVNMFDVGYNERFLLVDSTKRNIYKPYDFLDIGNTVPNSIFREKISPMLSKKGIIAYEIPNDILEYGLVMFKENPNDPMEILPNNNWVNSVLEKEKKEAEKQDNGPQMKEGITEQ